jgi:hypothetical protein
MERLFAPNGPFFEKEDYYAGEYFVDFRDEKDVNLSLDDLESKYPKEGRRKSRSFRNALIITKNLNAGSNSLLHGMDVRIILFFNLIYVIARQLCYPVRRPF